ncbi:SRPBCC family protein [Arenimonas composti]|uniref:Activator of Hsp90 ATPase homologue 1/2-like C-terminal domain-containing protein n=1 Tax=Arenimonas composti TR7-09 = DSM 18010 TaxID=1121013 RepID=A0A091BFS1_9GAMM|nr:SRPBCC family protein [Arenimonas composti]KFN51533.1 hypothetical protein P873_00300 [Arenimonas composti TR7-09 = DSM 18010]
MQGQPIPPSVIADPLALRYVRELAAPPERVFAAFTTPAQLAVWWGPFGFRTVTHAMDLRAGGHWVFTMIGPDGVEYPNFIDYNIVEAPRHLRWRHSGGADLPPDFQGEVRLTALANGGTRVEFTMHFERQADRDAKAAWGAAEGAQQTLDRLECELAGELVISRRFAAPRERIWRAWSEAAALARWWGPPQRRTTVEALDFRPGGRFLFRMDDGVDAWHAVLRYLAIEAPDRIQYDAAFCDAAGEAVPPPFDADWPLWIRYTVTFAEADGVTTLRLHGAAHAASDTQRAVFAGNFESMRGGFGASFARLQALLEHG